MLRSFPVALPGLAEQASIVEYLDKATADIAIARARRQIELLEEYRTRLIADVVTGKLDVREAAARLPEEVDEREPLDECGLMENDADAAADALRAEVDGMTTVSLSTGLTSVTTIL